ncbi:MAG: hypothetical protein ABT20_18695 [Rubrivivax sp. SCN 70-15]|nr:MAG: hypothetical protein ABT20_18695 [Rubrivivax sp. SCN 70-15]
MATPEQRRRHWRGNRRLTGLLLLVWFVVSFGASWFSRDLNFDFFGWPFGFWVASQGALLVYLAIVGVYARAMNRLDRTQGLDEGE